MNDRTEQQNYCMSSFFIHILTGPQFESHTSLIQSRYRAESTMTVCCGFNIIMFMCNASDVQPGLLAEQFLGLGIVDQDLIQVFLVQDEEIGKAVRDHVCCAPVNPANCKQTANQRDQSVRTLDATITVRHGKLAAPLIVATFNFFLLFFFFFYLW